MAENEDVINMLKSFLRGDWGNNLDCNEVESVLKLIQQQAQTIEHQNLQIAKLQEDLIKAISGKE